MAYGTVKVDNITFTNGGIDQTVTVSGIVQSISGNITATGTIQGATIIGTSTVSGATVTGDSGQYGNLNSISGVFTTQVSGATVTGDAGSFTTVTGGVATITSGVFALGTNALPSISFSSDPDTGIYSPGDNQVAISTNGTGRLFVDANGRVGVGNSSMSSFTANAGDNLVVGAGSSSEGITVYSGTTGQGSISFADGVTGDEAYRGYIAYNHTVDAFQFATAATEKLRITSTGTVNIVGAGTAGSSQAVSFNGSAPVDSLVIDSTGKVGLGTSAFSSGAIAEIATASGKERIYIQGNNNNANSYLYIEAPANRRKAVVFRSDGSDRACIGVGDSDELAVDKLFLSANVNSGGTSPHMVIDSSGRVGVGTTSPGVRLHVFNDADSAQCKIASSSSGNRAQIEFANAHANWSTGIIGGDTSGDYLLYCEAAKNIRIFTTNAERARIDSSGTFRVKGAGTAGVNDAVQLNGSAPANSLLLDASGRLLVGTSTESSNNLLVVEGNTASDTGGAIAALKRGTDVSGISADDTLGILRFTSKDSHVFADITGICDATPGANDYPGRLVFSTTADGAASSTERMRITSGGDIGFGNNIDFANLPGDGTSTALGVAVDGGILKACRGQYAMQIGVNDTGASKILAQFFQNGTPCGSIQVSNSNATAYVTSSDYRLKENLNAIDGAIDKLQLLKPCSFNFKNNPEVIVQGFIAHEVQDVVPEAIAGEKDEVDADGNPVYQGIDQSKLVPLLTAALQEAVAKIESLEARLTAAGL